MPGDYDGMGGTKVSAPGNRPRPPQAEWLQHHHLGVDADAAVELDDVLIAHSEAARGDGLADGPGLVGAVDAEERVAAALMQVERAGAERIFGAAGHGDGEVGLALAHFGRRRPGRPFGLAADPGDAGPADPVAADA